MRCSCLERPQDSKLPSSARIRFSMSRLKIAMRNGTSAARRTSSSPTIIVPITCVMVPTLHGAANYAWFIDMGLGFIIYAMLNPSNKT